MAALAVCFLSLALLAISAPAFRMSPSYFDESRSDDSNSNEQKSYHQSNNSSQNDSGDSDSSSIDKYQRARRYRSIYDCAQQSAERFVKGFGDYVAKQSRFFINQYKDGNVFDKHYFYKKAKFADFQAFKKFDINKDMADYENEFSRAQVVKFHDFQNDFYKNEARAHKFFFDKQLEFFSCVRQNYSNIILF